MFNTVFIDDVFVPDDLVLGEANRGWEVSRNTLYRGTGFDRQQRTWLPAEPDGFVEFVCEGHCRSGFAGVRTENPRAEPCSAPGGRT